MDVSTWDLRCMLCHQHHVEDPAPGLGLGVWTGVLGLGFRVLGYSLNSLKGGLYRGLYRGLL